jgi:LuxR family transcriptional regulator, maltose regulon positive regulatory protein
VSAAPTFAFDAPTSAVTDSGPRIRRGTVRRDRLVRTLVQSTGTPLVVVRAPAGYGKTTLLGQWAERDERPFAWIAPEAVSPGAALDCAARAFEALSSPAVAVLDGADVEAGFDELAAWTRELPAGSQLAVAVRGEPSLPLGSLRAQGLVIELGAPELAMTRREAAAMLSMAGVELEPADLAALLRHTEGWPAALYLAALSIRSGRDPHAAVAGFAGDDRLVADYLRDEILTRLHAPAVAFLLRTSVLARLSGSACDALLDRAGSGTLLRALSRAGIPIVPLDHADDEYRHHPLLAEMLRAEQRRRDPLRMAELHRRAGAWLEREGSIGDALGHALAAGDVADVGSRLWSIAPSRIAHGGVDEIRTWLDRLRPDQVSSHASLALAAAATHLVDGDRDRIEHWLDTAERLIAGGQQPEPAATAARGTLRASLARRGTAAMVRDAAAAYELAAEDDPWRPLACMLRGAGLHLLGDRARAVPVLEEGARRGGVLAPSAQVLCLAQLALIRADDGDWEEAALLASRARAQLERSGIARYPSSALVFAVSALVRAHRDRVEAAQDDRRQALSLLRRLVDPPPWYAVVTRIALARTLLRLGDAAGSRALLSEAGRMLHAVADAPLAAAWVEDGLRQADAFATSVLTGPASLTNAELRVLRLLPTHLSFREMGLYLHVTANTVKTHAHAVYRKLDASSRSEAVVQARGIGLLDDLARMG